jgi:hypothetical protein
MSAIRLSIRRELGAEKICLINGNLFVLREELDPSYFLSLPLSDMDAKKQKTDKE